MLKSAPKSLYAQVILGVILGALVGHFWPSVGADMKPLGDAFIRGIRMVVAPIIFVTIAAGIAQLHDGNKVGRIGLKALVYFEVMTTLAMVIGMVVGHLVAPGSGLNIDPHTLDTASIAAYTAKSAHQDFTGFLVNIIPNTIVGAFAAGDTLQVLLLAILTGFALGHLRQRVELITDIIDQSTAVLFRVLAIVMRFAPLGVFGAMAFSVGRYGVGALMQLGLLVLCFYVTLLVFIVVVLGCVLRVTGLRLWPLTRYIREEIIIVLSTSTTEPVLPLLLVKLQRLGCAKPVVGLTLPLGYAFNLDGTSMYFTLAIPFIAQALNIHLSFGEYASILAVLLVASKGAATAPGAGFITLAATLAALDGKVPVAGIVLILGVDRFMSEARGIGNLYGNVVATIFVSWWEGALDVNRARRVLAGEVIEDESTTLSEPGSSGGETGGALVFPGSSTKLATMVTPAG
jgi:aerobic C4-dicarboxylate transport protein